MTSHILFFLLAFLLLIHFFDSPRVFLFYHGVCQQQYLLLLLLLLYARVLIIKSYNQLLQIFHLHSWEFSPFLQFNCITYCQSQVLFTTLDIPFEASCFSVFSLHTNLTFCSWRSCWKDKRVWQVLYIFPSSILGNRSFFLMPLLFFAMIPFIPYASFFLLLSDLLVPTQTLAWHLK